MSSLVNNDTSILEAQMASISVETSSNTGTTPEDDEEEEEEVE